MTREEEEKALAALRKDYDRRPCMHESMTRKSFFGWYDWVCDNCDNIVDPNIDYFSQYEDSLVEEAPE